MGREIRRVPLDFDAPLNEVWAGFLMPDELHADKCPQCHGDGYSPRARELHNLWYGYVPFRPEDNGSTPLTPETPAVRAFAERNVMRSPEFYGDGEYAIWAEAKRLADMWNGQWSHHLNADDVAALVEGGRLHDLTSTWSKADGWQLIDPPVMPTPDEVNTWALSGFGHDAINQWIAVRARCDREGVVVECSGCGGHGEKWRDDAHKAAHEAWKRTAPPAGDGWQLWSTVTEGSPISPVFASADGLAGWMSDPERGEDWVPQATAATFIADGWAPTFIGSEATGVVSGVEFIGHHSPPRSNETTWDAP